VYKGIKKNKITKEKRMKSLREYRTEVLKRALELELSARTIHYIVFSDYPSVNFVKTIRSYKLGLYGETLIQSIENEGL